MSGIYCTYSLFSGLEFENPKLEIIGESSETVQLYDIAIGTMFHDPTIYQLQLLGSRFNELSEESRTYIATICT